MIRTMNGGLETKFPQEYKGPVFLLESCQNSLVRKRVWSRSNKHFRQPGDPDDLIEFFGLFASDTEIRQLKGALVVQFHRDKKCQNAHILDTECLSSSAFEESQMSILTHNMYYVSEYP